MTEAVFRQTGTGCGGDAPAQGARLAAASELDASRTALAGGYRRYAALCGLTAGAIGLTAMIGWIAHVPLLTSFRADLVPMKWNTAVCLLACGVALFHIAYGRRPWLTGACALLVLVVATLTLIEYGAGWELGIDQLLIREAPGAVGGLRPGRMALITAVQLVLLCGAFLGFLIRRPGPARLPGLLALPVLVISAVATVGFSAGSGELASLAGNVTAMAAPTAIAFVFLAMGTMFVRIEGSVLGRLASPLTGGVMLRMLLPVAVVLPVVIVWSRIWAGAAGLFHTVEFGAAAVAVANVVGWSGALLWCASLLDGLDQQRRESEAQVVELNRRLSQQVIDLETANRELEGFSYSASHVLRAPLRALDGFSRILLDDYSGRLDAEGKRLLGVIRSSAREMSDLIDGILGFLRLARVPMTLGPVDMTVEAQAALAGLEPLVRGRECEIDIEPMPAAWGDAAMIRRVWSCLLDNALKFTSPRPRASIRVGAIPVDGETAYYVKDDGVGFDMQYAGKLFGVFNRLHGAEFPGNGMGLAVVQRIVARHGGRAWAEGKPDEGAVLYFSLPNPDKANA